MDQVAYRDHVTQGLLELGFTRALAPEEDSLPLLAAFERSESWGRLLLAIFPLEAISVPEQWAALSESASLWAEREHRQSAQSCYLILVFPFPDGIAQEQSTAIRSLRVDDPGQRWGLIPWTVDLEVELVDQHTGFPRLPPAVARTLTEVPRSRAAQAWRRASGPRIGARSPVFGWLGSVPVTRGILSLTIAYYVAAILLGGGGFSLMGGISRQLLISWGGNHGSLVLEAGQHWRLVTYLLLHGGLLHLAFNMWALWNVGRYVELLFGSGRMLFIYLFAGVAAGMSSTMLRPEYTWSVGASGAILGLFGALIYFARAMPGRHVDIRQLSGIVIINLAYGFFLPIIDNYAHIGGFVAGYAAAFLAGIAGERLGWRTAAVGAACVVMGLVLVGVVPLVHLPLFR